MNVRKVAIAVAAVALVGGSSAAAVGGAGGGADNGGPGAVDSLVGGAANHGQVLCTAAINADGSNGGVGQHLDDPNTFRLSAGQYQVVFRAPCTNITAARGYARMVQPDTLSFGSNGPSYCATADRAGSPNGVYVECYDGAGVLSDQSFFIFVTR